MTALAHRLATLEDLRFVRQTWIDSYRHSRTSGILPAVDGECIEVKSCPSCQTRVSVDRGYNAAMGPAIDWLFSRAGVEVWVAFHPDEAPPEDLYGWICIERGALEPVKVREGGQTFRVLRKTRQPVVHYVYVRLPFRELGVAAGLFRAAGVDPRAPFIFTASTGASYRLRDKIPGGRFDTRLARFPKHEPYEDPDDEIALRSVPAERAGRRPWPGDGA